MADHRAIIDPDARLGRNVTVGPWSIIGPGVEIGDDTYIDSHVVIRANTRIGRNNRIFQFSSIGEDPSDKKFAGEETFLEIGDNNVFREGANIHRGTGVGGGLTRIGSDNLFMPYSHVAHDCLVANHTIFSNNAAISGHVQVDDWAILGGYSGVYQFLHIGAHSFIGAQTHLNMDVPAFMVVNGQPPAPKGINITGLQRRGFSPATIRTLRQAYRTIYREGLSLNEAITRLQERVEEEPNIAQLIASLQRAVKGIVR